jgi:glyoxylase-like metal-dependent hydrolase (beta-lactamase superfamily II)
MVERDAADGIHRVEDAYTNWYLVETDDGLLVVDAGVPTSWRSLHEALRELGRRPDDVRAILLTHGHFDHIGFAERARQELGVPVWVHEDDVLLTRRPRRYGNERSPLAYLLTQPKALPIQAAFVRARAFFPKPIGDVLRYEERIDVAGAPDVVPTPGHTIGHCALHFPDRDAVIAGDAVVTLNPYTGATGPQIVARCANADSERALASLDALAATGARTVLTGHGPVWREGAEAAAAAARASGIS